MMIAVFPDDAGRVEAMQQQAATQEATPEAMEAARQDAAGLRISEVRYRRLFEAAQDGILILDAATGKIEDVNPYLCRLKPKTGVSFRLNSSASI